MSTDRFTGQSLQIASQALAQKDPSLWGESARPTAIERLGWIDLPEKSRELLPTLDALAAWARSERQNRFVLSGMGGSSLAPEVISATLAHSSGESLVILDSTHPDDVKGILDVDPEQTLFVISSKSGETIETLSHLKVVVERLGQAKLKVSDHVVVITDPGSPLAKWATDSRVRIFYGEPTVGGRFSALSIFGLLPAALLGADCATLLDDAAEMKSILCNSTESNLAIRLSQEIIESQPFLKLPNTPLSDWIEQLVAESTGKDGTGIIPVISSDAQLLPTVRESLQLPLGAAFYLWEWTTALLGYLLQVNPFDQPDVAGAKEGTKRALSNALPLGEETIKSSAELLSYLEALQKSSSNPLAHSDGYLAILAFVPSRAGAIRNAILSIRQGLHHKFGSRTPITLGFGPRYLHSTGQCHKGGPTHGVFLIITLDERIDYPIPGVDYGFQDLQMAQARGDFHALEKLGRQVVHAHLSRVELEVLSRALHVTS